MSPATLAERITEQDSTRRWRLNELMRAGYPPSDALVLSGRLGIDLHAAIRLLQAGCPVRTAMRILL